MRKEQLTDMEKLDIRTVKKESLVDLKDMKIDKAKSERIEKFIEQVNNHIAVYVTEGMRIFLDSYAYSTSII